MPSLRFRFVRTMSLAVAVLVLAGPSPAPGQQLADDMVGQTAESWALWVRAVAAIDREQAEQADALFGQVLALNSSELRLALMAHDLERGVVALARPAGTNAEPGLDRERGGLGIGSDGGGQHFAHAGCQGRAIMPAQHSWTSPETAPSGPRRDNAAGRDRT